MVKRQWLAEQPPMPRAAVTSSATPEPQSVTSSQSSALELPAGCARAIALESIQAIAASFRLEAGVARSQPGQLVIRFADADDVSLEMCIECARGDGQYYERCGKLGFWYGRAQFREDIAPHWMEPLFQLVVELLAAPEMERLADELERTATEAATTPASSPTPIGPSASSPEPVSSVTIEPVDPYARVKVLGPDDVERFFHVDYEYDEGAHVDQPPTARLGIIYQCNQPCTFCQLAEMNTHIPPARIYAALDASRARGAVRVILTGGEPTLCRHLPDYIRYAREHGFTTIELQTNATLMDKPGLAQRLRDAGLTDAQVSLHGPDSDISDRLTAAPGTHQRTLAGIGNLLDAGVRVLLNHLIFRDNCHLLLDFVDMVERRWGQHRDRVIIQFHTPLNEFAQTTSARQHIARYTEYAAMLQKAIDRARSLGYMFKDLQDPTGIPALCVLGLDSEYLGPILSQRVKPRFHRWESEWMTRVEACQSCDVADACMGIPKVYVALHGTEEFQAIRLRPEGDASASKEGSLDLPSGQG